SGTNLTLHIYDPNQPADDTIKLSLSLANSQQTTDVSYTASLGGDGKIWCFFRSVYSPIVPPKSLTGATSPSPPRGPSPPPHTVAPTIQSPLTGDGTDIVVAQVTENAASASDRVALKLTVSPNINWWKAANLANQEVWTQDQTKQGSIEVALS